MCRPLPCPFCRFPAIGRPIPRVWLLSRFMASRPKGPRSLVLVAPGSGFLSDHFHRIIHINIQHPPVNGPIRIFHRASFFLFQPPDERKGRRKYRSHGLTVRASLYGLHVVVEGRGSGCSSSGVCIELSASLAFIPSQW